MDNEKNFYVPDYLKTPEAIKRFEENYYSVPKFNEFDKIQMKRSIRGGKLYSRLNTSLYILEFMDIPFELVKRIEFIGEKKLEITFFETAEFCVEKYFETNFDVLKDKKLKIKYLNKEGFAIRTDEYVVSKLRGTKKGPLSYEIEDLTYQVILEYSSHDISTCKE